eukprot:CAMPEP_0117450818 /NCGR_PEP_ID=MMETSP0759-20121206/8671_1 /TAXON_ID=63605 /ORGANISM="Percolomonas cosmopolitus, Strain WS" /LENGTH=382 /DNA_ID=CAMNT_0005243365 /DNA_START=91 /DNA_END=1236 /DNA_ORIENTATION=+
MPPKRPKSHAATHPNKHNKGKPVANKSHFPKTKKQIKKDAKKQDHLNLLASLQQKHIPLFQQKSTSQLKKEYERLIEQRFEREASLVTEKEYTSNISSQAHKKRVLQAENELYDTMASIEALKEVLGKQRRVNLEEVLKGEGELKQMIQQRRQNEGKMLRIGSGRQHAELGQQRALDLSSEEFDYYENEDRYMYDEDASLGEHQTVKEHQTASSKHQFLATVEGIPLPHFSMPHRATPPPPQEPIPMHILEEQKRRRGELLQGIKRKRDVLQLHQERILKRVRLEEKHDVTGPVLDHQSKDDFGPAPPPTILTTSVKLNDENHDDFGPAVPPPAATINQEQLSGDLDDEDDFGPSPPPLAAPLLPQQPEMDNASSDDDFGPA